MTTVTTNDFKIFQNGTWVTPSNISTYSNTVSTFGGLEKVYVYVNGNWVQSWPPITANIPEPGGNITYGFNPTSMLCTTSSVHYADFDLNEYPAVYEASTVITKAANFYPYDTTKLDLVPNVDSTWLVGASGSGTGKIVAYRGLGYQYYYDIPGLHRTEWNSTYHFPPVPTVPSNAQRIAWGTSRNKFNAFRMINVQPLFYSNYNPLGKYYGLLLVGDGGQITVTNALWTKPTGSGGTSYDPVPDWLRFRDTGGFATSNVTMYTKTSGTTENLTDLSFHAGTYQSRYVAVGDNATVLIWNGITGAITQLPKMTGPSGSEPSGTPITCDFRAVYSTPEIISVDAETFMVGTGGRIYTLGRLGEMYYLAAMPPPTTYNLNDVVAYADAEYVDYLGYPVVVWVCGDNGFVAKGRTPSIQQGFTWTVYNLGTTVKFNSITMENQYMSGNTTIYQSSARRITVTGENGAIYRTTDYGQTWINETSAAITGNIVHCDQYLRRY